MEIDKQIPTQDRLPRNMKHAAMCYEFQIKPLVLEGVPLSLQGVQTIIEEYNQSALTFQDEQFTLDNLLGHALARKLTSQNNEDQQCFAALLSVCQTSTLLPRN